MAGQTLKPPFGYYGAKTVLAPKIVNLLPAHEHYVEPFAGSLAVLLAKERSALETVNDLDGTLMTFWKVLQNQPRDLERLVRLTPQSRGFYLEAAEKLADTSLPPLEKAHAVFVVLSQGRSNSLKATGWRNELSNAVGMSRSMYLKTYADRLGPAAERLAGVALESMDAIELIDYYGAEPSVCIYADPPYVGSVRASNYRIEMLEDDLHVRLARSLNECKASVVLSGYASPLYEELYEGWHRYELKAPPNLAKTETQNEVLWSNVPLGDQASLF